MRKTAILLFVSVLLSSLLSIGVFAADTLITAVKIGITVPVAGKAPDTGVRTEVKIDTGFYEKYTGTVAWSGNPSTFAENTKYTATVTLTPITDYAFTEATTAMINGYAAATTELKSGKLVLTIEYTTGKIDNATYKVISKGAAYKFDGITIQTTNADVDNKELTDGIDIGLHSETPLLTYRDSPEYAAYAMPAGQLAGDLYIDLGSVQKFDRFRASLLNNRSVGIYYPENIIGYVYTGTATTLDAVMLDKEEGNWKSFGSSGMYADSEWASVYDYTVVADTQQTGRFVRAHIIRNAEVRGWFLSDEIYVEEKEAAPVVTTDAADTTTTTTTPQTGNTIMYFWLATIAMLMIPAVVFNRKRKSSVK